MRNIDTWTGGTADIELLQRCKEAIKNVVADGQVILYGSRARGDARDDSDYDVMVIVNGPVDMSLKEKILDKIYPLELETEQMVSLLVYSKKKWDSALWHATPLHKNVDAEGVLL